MQSQAHTLLVVVHRPTFMATMLCCAVPPSQTMEQYVFVYKALLDELSVRLKGSSGGSSDGGSSDGDAGSGGSSGHGL